MLCLSTYLIPQPRTLDRNLQLNLILQLTAYLRSELKVFRKWKKDPSTNKCRVPWYRQLAYTKGALPFVLAVSVVQWLDRHWAKLGPRPTQAPQSFGDDSLRQYVAHLIQSGEARCNIVYVLEKPHKFTAEIMAHRGAR